MTHPHHVKKARITKSLCLVLRMLIDVSIQDECTGSIHTKLLAPYQEKDRRVDGGTL